MLPWFVSGIGRLAGKIPILLGLTYPCRSIPLLCFRAALRLRMNNEHNLPAGRRRSQGPHLMSNYEASI